MTTAEVKLDFSSLVGRVELKDVRLKEAVVRTEVRDLSAVPEAQPLVNHGARVIARRSNGFMVLAEATIHVVKRGDEPTDKAPIFMSTVFALTYAVADAENYSDETLAQFASLNGTFNAWPYLREYVQSTTARMNLPPLVLPVFRAPVPPAAPVIASEKPAPPVELKTVQRARRAWKKKASHSHRKTV